MSERRTDATESGSSHDWATPTVAVATGGQTSRSGARKGELLLTGQVQQNWTTPQAHDAQGAPNAARHGRFGTKHGGRNLPDHVAAVQQNWVTPPARDGESRGVQSMRERVAQGHSMSLPEQMVDTESAWPTPASRDWRDDGDCPSAQARKSPCLPAAVTLAMWPTVRATTNRTGRRYLVEEDHWSAPGLEQMAEIAAGILPHEVESINEILSPTARAMWPMATASDANSSGAAGYSTASGRHSGTTLTDATVGPRGQAIPSTAGKSPALWTTPCADDTGARKDKYAQGGTALSTQVRARLNHRWVAQLMGYPADYLDIDEQP